MAVVQMRLDEVPLVLSPVEEHAVAYADWQAAVARAEALEVELWAARQRVQSSGERLRAAYGAVVAAGGSFPG